MQNGEFRMQKMQNDECRMQNEGAGRTGAQFIIVHSPFCIL